MLKMWFWCWNFVNFIIGFVDVGKNDENGLKNRVVFGEIGLIWLNYFYL